MTDATKARAALADRLETFAFRSSLRSSPWSSRDAVLVREAVEMLRSPIATLPQSAGEAIEPTEAMLVAARDWSYKKYGKPIGNDAATGCWKAMLAAAPPSPSGEPVTVDMLKRVRNLVDYGASSRGEILKLIDDEIRALLASPAPSGDSIGGNK